MTLQQIQYFIAVAECGSVGGDIQRFSVAPQPLQAVELPGLAVEHVDHQTSVVQQDPDAAPPVCIKNAIPRRRAWRGGACICERAKGPAVSCLSSLCLCSNAVCAARHTPQAVVIFIFSRRRAGDSAPQAGDQI